MRRLIKYGVVIATCCLAAAACSSNSSSSTSGGGGAKASGTLTIDNESGGNWTCQFSPFSGASQGFALGFVYEPLMFVNALQNQKTTPWLATSYAWSNGDKTLTFTIRNGVKFTNGDPMTAADVVYTFNLLKKNPTLDLNAIWTVLSSVTQSGSNQVVVQFKAPALTYFYYIADQVGIVDQKVWSKISDPTKFTDPNPIGTGPYMTGAHSCAPQNIKYTANPHYWQPGLPKVETIEYPAFLTNDTANNFMAQGNMQWGGQFIPDITKFLAGQPAIKWWFPGVANVSMFINLTNPILKNVAVRQAMAYAVNRPKASQLGEFGEEPPSNQTDIVTPTYSSWLDTTQAAAYGNNYAYNPAKAVSILKAAGFTKGSDGIFAKGGQKLSFTILNNGGFSDWVNAVNVIVANLKAVGIQVTPEDLSQTTYQNKLFAGQFQLAYGSEGGGPSPYFELRQLLYSGNTKPIGTPAGSNYERYINKATDNLILAFPQAMTLSAQQAIINQLQKVMLADVPVIPMTQSVDWFQYDTSKFSGWPTPANPYAQPAPYNAPDWEVVMLHLKPIG